MAWRVDVSTRRLTSIGLTGLLLGGAFVGWRGFEAAPSKDVEAARFSEKRAMANVLAGPGVAGKHRIVEFLQPVAAQPQAARAPVSLSADAAALTAEVATLQLLAQDTDLDLSARQWSALAAVTSNIQAVRQAYEASIATATTSGPGRYRVEIPVYAAAGDGLRAKFHAELREHLGDANAAEILARLGSRLESHFAGFGVSAQTLEIVDAARGQAAGAEVAVTRTARYWNSVEGQERLATRRETHFPAQEDPTGELWRPMLALIAQAAGTGTGS
jgi:hypothetical protein